ncbi:hypothetical protein [Erythrobacter sp.]|uniref:DUF4760 domain-containing protein n=1 Tax=Erythrobacter sp. TaxID=1042 RepID=UPI001B205C89|nr:hypothetical protein [Erythrobacter sp.]MBO6527702.1 hypothetical protein [Erythrobacter sp.]MBO6530043.1 hypothetical protein [Erythrobacter sp.]
MDIIQYQPPDIFMQFVAGLTVLATLGLLRIAHVQLTKIVEANNAQANVATATLLLEIDRMFEGHEIMASRQKIRTLRNRCEALAGEMHEREDVSQAKFAEDLFSQELDDLLAKYKEADEKPKSGEPQATGDVDSSADAYASYMRLPYWMETVALMVRRGLLDEEVVLELYDEVFATTLSCFINHIENRRNAGPISNARFLIQATSFRDKALKHKTKKEKELHDRKLASAKNADATP